MSRCFPYPPPGYVVKCTRDEALIESLKLQKEAEKAKKERRKERKKEKREEKKRRRDEENKKHGHEKGHKHERSHVDHKEGDFQKRKENETEQWEKSTLTEEHGQAFGSHNLCNSTESTLNSDKRQKQKQSSPSDCKPNHGSIIRIRLPLQRHKDPEVLPNTEQPCSSSISGRINNFVQEVHEFPRSSTEPPDCLQQECSTSGQIGPELVSRPSKEKSRPGTSQTDAHSQMVESASLSCSRSRVPHPVEMQFRDLMWKWTPHSLQSDCAGLYDEGWLFETKLDFDSGAKRFKTTDGSCCANDTLMPSASYLPEVDIYALPFTVPF